MDECAILQGRETAGVYWDMEKFYDSIDWVRLVEWCVDLHLRARMLEIMMSLHTAQRVIKIGEVYSERTLPYNSVVAGCCSAIWLSRIFVCTMLMEVYKQGSVETRNFFDDMVSRATNNDPEVLILHMVEHCTNLAFKIAGSRLTFNKGKTFIVASKRWIADGIAKLLSARGIEIGVAEQVRDLGIDAG